MNNQYEKFSARAALSKLGLARKEIYLRVDPNLPINPNQLNSN